MNMSQVRLWSARDGFGSQEKQKLIDEVGLQAIIDAVANPPPVGTLEADKCKYVGTVANEQIQCTWELREAKKAEQNA